MSETTKESTKKTKSAGKTKTPRVIKVPQKKAAQQVHQITDFIHRITLKRAIEKKWAKKLEVFSTGDTLNVYVRIKEGEKERVQVYKGVVIKMQGSGIGKTFTVRKISSGVGVERTFPFFSPNIEKVEVVNRGKVRRSRLYFLRGLAGRAARLDSDLVVFEGDNASAAGMAATDVAPPEKTAEKADKKT
jgi:large subunit ribosomal protein L19